MKQLFTYCYAYPRGRTAYFVSVWFFLLFLMAGVIAPVRAQVTNIILDPGGSGYCQNSTVNITFTISGISLLSTTTVEILDASNAALASVYSGTSGLLDLGGGVYKVAVTIPTTPAVIGTGRKFKISYSGVLIGSGSGTSSSFAIYAPSVGGVVSAPQTICNGSSPADLSLSGATGTVLRWQRSADNTFTSPVTIAVANTVLPGATIGSLSSNTYFRAVVQNGTCAEAYASAVLITVIPVPAGSLALVASPLCTGQQVQLVFTATQGTAPFELIVNGHSYSGVQSGVAFNLNPNVTSTTTLDLTQITDVNGCVLANP